MGQFSCCRMNHVLPNGDVIPCDKVALTNVVNQVHRRKVWAHPPQGRRARRRRPHSPSIVKLGLIISR